MVKRLLNIILLVAFASCLSEVVKTFDVSSLLTENKKEYEDKLTDTSSLFLSLLAERNQEAELTSHQNYTIYGSGFFRRISFGRECPGKMNFYPLHSSKINLPYIYHLLNKKFRNYSALKKNSGFFIYGLRKIII